MARGAGKGWLVRLPPMLWLVVFYLVPFLIVAKISLSQQAARRPPYLPVFDPAAGWEAFGAALGALSFDNFVSVVADDLIWSAYRSSLVIAAVSTVIALVLGLAIALPMARAPRRWQPVLVMLVVLPLLTSFLIRAYAWIAILKPEGFLNGALMALGLIREPLAILNTDVAVVIGIVYSYLPFMILPLYASLEKFDPSVLEAAADLGARPAQTFFLITLPMIRPAVLAGSALVFIPAAGEFIVPDLLGGSDTLMIGRVVWTTFFSERDWPLASALAIVLLSVVLVPLVLGRRRAPA